MTADTQIRCEHYRCTLAAKHCVQRQTVRVQSLVAKLDGSRKVSAPAHLQYCASGQCLDGLAVRRVVGHVAPPARLNAEKLRAVRAARKAKSLIVLPEANR